MLKTVNIITPLNDVICLKKINNIHIYLPNKVKHIYQNNKYNLILNHIYIYTYINYFLRIVWRGKAYRVRLFKKKLKFTFNFGHSHWYKLMYDKKHFNFSRIRRQNYVVVFSKRENFFFIKKIFNKIRTYNKYTRRGIRFKKTPFIKRFGKISQVNSILHSF